MIKIIIFLIAINLYGQTFPKNAVVPGGVIKQVFSSNSKPKAYFKDKELLVINGEKKNEYIVLAGIPLDYKAGDKFPIVVKNRDSVTEFTPTVKEKKYQKQYIKLKTDKHVVLSKKDLERYYKEKSKSDKALNRFTKKKFEPLKMIKPIDLKISDDFGKKRYFNNKPKKPHSGVDLAAPKGTPIKAPLDGEVVIADDFFFNGKVVYIDHGLGLTTTYSHLDKILVKEGQRVNQSQIIGKVGETGRVTGAHLHWSIALNGNMVNPRLFVD